MAASAEWLPGSYTNPMALILFEELTWTSDVSLTFQSACLYQISGSMCTYVNPSIPPEIDRGSGFFAQ